MVLGRGAPSSSPLGIQVPYCTPSLCNAQFHRPHSVLLRLYQPPCIEEKLDRLPHRDCIAASWQDQGGKEGQIRRLCHWGIWQETAEDRMKNQRGLSKTPRMKCVIFLICQLILNRSLLLQICNQIINWIKIFYYKCRHSLLNRLARFALITSLQSLQHFTALELSYHVK